MITSELLRDLRTKKDKLFYQFLRGLALFIATAFLSAFTYLVFMAIQEYTIEPFYEDGSLLKTHDVKDIKLKTLETDKFFQPLFSSTKILFVS